MTTIFYNKENQVNCVIKNSFLTTFDKAIDIAKELLKQNNKEYKYAIVKRHNKSVRISFNNVVGI